MNAFTSHSSSATKNISTGVFNQSDSKSKKSVETSGKNSMTLPTTQDNHNFTPDQIEILKNSLCKGVSDEEFKVFLMACAKTKLDPFMRQIYAVKRWDARLGRETMTIQTGIDGYRLIAERTGRYAPGRKPSFEYSPTGDLISATAYVKKLTPDGTWHEVEAEAFFEEYCQTVLDKQTNKRKAIGMWASMQRNQLAKCAESLCLRKAFPAEMSGVYTRDEMQQAQYHAPEAVEEVQEVQEVKPVIDCIDFGQEQELTSQLEKCDPRYQRWFVKYIQDKYKIDCISKIPAQDYKKTLDAVLANVIAE